MYLWTDDIRIIVAGLLRDGLSAAQIGRQIGTTRNAVIGKVARDDELKSIGFARRPSDQLYVSKKSKPAKQRPLMFKQAVIKIEKPVTEDKAGAFQTVGKPLIALAAYECKWAVTDNEPGDITLFCGCKTDEGRSWCTHHASRAIQHRKLMPLEQLAGRVL